MCMKEEQFKTCNNRFVTHSFVYQFCWLISTRNLSLGTLITYVLPNIVIRWSLAEDRIGQYGSLLSVMNGNLNLHVLNVHLTYLFYRLQEVLKEYDSVVSGIPENVLPLMKPFTDRVDETIKPGLTMLNWTSLNVHSCEYNH